jgi:signal transduction histidine kinase
MPIRARLTLIFGSVLVFVILVISSYSILTIRDYLERKAVQDARALLQAIALNWDNDKDLAARSAYLQSLAEWTHSSIYVIDSKGKMLWKTNDEAEFDAGLLAKDADESDFVGASTEIQVEGNQATVWVLFSRKAISLSLMPIRYIIYYGMLISLILIIIVSIWTGRSLAKPIRSLTETASEISEGNLDKELHLNRTDEFGRLSKALNSMAETLKKDAETQKRINARQKQLYANIAHEVRNPIQSIMTSSGILNLKQVDQARKDQALQVIQNQVNRLNYLFQDLITLNQLEDERGALLEVDDFDIAELCRKVVAHHQEEINADILLVDETESLNVRADKFRIEQVMENLFVNAINYTEKGTIRLKTQKQGDKVWTSISDSGIGMSEDEVSKAFDRFYRVEKARTRNRGGSGLGLSVVKQILDIHESELQIKSSPGKGTTVQFSLPLSL